jgi:hypothetical protein
MSLSADAGVYYVARGREYVEEAVQSAESVKRCTELPTALCTDKRVDHSAFDHVIVSNAETNDPYERKVRGLHEAPFEQTLFLDTDTYVCREISDLFSLLEEFELAAAHAPNRMYHPGGGYPSEHPVSFPELNTGVLLMDTRSSRVEQLLNDWLETHREMQDAGVCEGGPVLDQIPFREVIYDSEVRFTVLTPEYNCRFEFPVFLEGPVRILHGRHPDLETVAELLNERTHRRAFHPDVFDPSPSDRFKRFLRRVYDEMKTLGLITLDEYIVDSDNDGSESRQ